MAPLGAHFGNIVATVYDAAGQVVAQIDERGNRTEFVFDAAGGQTVVRDALGHETTTAYDDAGRRIAMTDALGHTTRFMLDGAGRQTATQFADGTQTAQTLDARGQVVARIDQAGRTTQYEYDTLGRLSAVVDALNQRTEYGYDEAGNLISQQDANGHITRYEYDGLNRRVASVLPLGQRSTTTFDAAGNVARTVDFNGAAITFDYDARNRLATKHYPDGTSVSFTYTPTGQRQTYTDARGVTRWAYDARDRLLSRTDPDGTSISYTYDSAGNRTSVTTPAGITSYTFDALNRTATVTDPQGGITRYRYDADGNLAETDLPNGTTETRTYDDLNRLVFLENDGSGGVVSSYQYTLGPTGRRDAVVEDTGRRVDYGYDALDRLTHEAIIDATFGNRTIDYTYDPVGNRLSRNDSSEGITDYTYDANDRLLTETLQGVETDYAYDANGNTLAKTSPTDHVSYTWDFENRLIAADSNGDGSNDVTNRYDADGIRVSQTASGQETRYLIDTVQPYAQVLLEYRPSGLALASYVYGNGLIEQSRGGVLSYYHVDGLGSTRALTDTSGLVTDRYVYDAFGRMIRQTGSTVNSYLFAGQQRDANTGLDYLRARYLNVGTGRFVSRDTFDGIAGRPSTLNDYLYASGKPVDRLDPSGHFDLVEIAAGLAIQDALGTLTSLQLSFAKAGLKAVQRTLKISDQLLQPAVKIQEVGLNLIDADVSGYGPLDGFEIYEIGRLLASLGYRAVGGVILGIYKETAESLVIGSIPIVKYLKDVDYFLKNLSPFSVPKIYDVGTRLDNFIVAVRTYVVSPGLRDLLSSGTGNAEKETKALFLAADDVLSILGKLK